MSDHADCRIITKPLQPKPPPLGPCQMSGPDDSVCPFFDRCKREQLACKAFTIFVGSGRYAGKWKNHPIVPKKDILIICFPVEKSRKYVKPHNEGVPIERGRPYAVIQVSGLTHRET